LAAPVAALVLGAGVIAALGLQSATAVESKAAVASYVGPSANLVSQGNSGQCLDAKSEDYANDGDPIQLWGCNTNPEQEWALTPAGQLENTASGMCLDANSDNYPTDGDGIQLWGCNTHSEQEWALTPAGQLENIGHPGMCLDANSDNYPNDGDGIQLWGCNTHPEQEWAPGTVGAKIVDAAASMLGYHYCWDGGGTSGPTHGDGNTNGATDCGTGVVGFDCTGLSLYAVYYATHIALPHGQGIENVKGGTEIKSESQLEPGDIILAWRKLDLLPARRDLRW